MSTGEIIGALSDLATPLGIPIALLIFIDEKRRERKDREYGTMADYARHPTFRTLWEKRGVRFDRDFMAHMKATMDDSVVL